MTSIKMNSEKEVAKYFETLSASDQAKLLAKLNKLKKKGADRGNRKNGIEFIKRLKDEIASAHGHGRYNPRDINNSTLNLIILEAKNAQMNESVLMKLERLAYRGLVEWANRYGYLSEQDEDFAIEHLTKYIVLVKDLDQQYNPSEILEEEKLYLEKLFKDNFYSEYIRETFEDLTGLKIHD